MDELLSRLGLDEKEAKTFMRLLSLGAQPVSVIARHVGLPRSSMYFIVEKLKKHRLVEVFERVGMTYVKCIPVRDIVNVLRAEERTIKQTVLLLEEALPALEALENTLSITPTVKFSEGKDAVMKMYEEVLRERQLCALFNPAFVKRIMPEYHFRIPEVLRENRAVVRELLVDCPQAHEYRRKFSSRRHQIGILPKRIRFESDCIICRDRLYLIAYGEAQISAVEILSPSLTRTQKTLFEELWGRYYRAASHQ